jgi:replication factor A1
VYLLSGGRVKVADKKYSNGREYELSFDEKSAVTSVVDDAAIKTINFAFVPIAELPKIEGKKNLDIIGMLRSVNDSQDITSKKGQALTKRDLSLADDSGHAVNVTMWGESARSFAGTVGQVLAIKNAQLSEWDGRSCQTGFSSTLMIEPGNEAAARIHAYFAADPGRAVYSVSEKQGGGGGGGEGGNSIGLSDLSMRKMCGDVKESGIQNGVLSADQLYFMRATVEVNAARKDADKLWYPACKAQRDNRTCQKKITDGGGGQWQCDICGIQDRPECASGGGGA